MMHHHSNAANYFYSNLNPNNRPENSNIATTTSADGITGSSYLWHFTGNDPYGVGLANKAINDVGATTTPGEWLVKQNANITGNWYRTVDGYHADNGASMVMLRHDDGSYNLFIVSKDSERWATQVIICILLKPTLRTIRMYGLAATTRTRQPLLSTPPTVPGAA